SAGQGHGVQGEPAGWGFEITCRDPDFVPAWSPRERERLTPSLTDDGYVPGPIHHIDIEQTGRPRANLTALRLTEGNRVPIRRKARAQASAPGPDQPRSNGFLDFDPPADAVRNKHRFAIRCPVSLNHVIEKLVRSLPRQ